MNRVLSSGGAQSQHQKHASATNPNALNEFLQMLDETERERECYILLVYLLMIMQLHVIIFIFSC